MEARFNAAQAGRDPKLARDSLAVLEPIRALVSADRISADSIDAVLERMDQLSIVAADADLREGIEESRALIGKDLSRRQCLDILKKIRQASAPNVTTPGRRDRACRHHARPRGRPPRARVLRADSRGAPPARHGHSSAARPRLPRKLRL